MAFIRGTNGPDRIVPGSTSPGVTGGPVTDFGDQVFAGDGDDTLTGGSGDDSLYGGIGLNVMTGGLGNDSFVVSSSSDVLIEQADGGTDTVWANVSYLMPAQIEIGRALQAGITLSAAGNLAGVQMTINTTGAVTLIGGSGDDQLWGGSAGSQLIGGGGGDTLRDQGFSTRMAGGTGDDTYVVTAADSTVQENAGEGTDTLWVTFDGYVAPLNVEFVRLTGLAVYGLGSAGGEGLVANPLRASLLDGQGGNDTLYGSLFGDVLQGGAGDDVVLGQGGADTVFGGAGNDWMVVTDVNSVIVENAGEGNDRVVFAGRFGNLFIGENVEEGQLIGSATAITGNSQRNVLWANESGLASSLTGGAGNDVLLGSTGRDTLVGGAGSDYMIGGGGLDVFVFDGRSAWGNDEIFGFSSATNFGNTPGSKLIFTDLFSFFSLRYAYGQGNTYITSGSNPDFGVITVHGATVQSFDVMFG